LSPFTNSADGGQGICLTAGVSGQGKSFTSLGLDTAHDVLELVEAATTDGHFESAAGEAAGEGGAKTFHCANTADPGHFFRNCRHGIDSQG